MTISIQGVKVKKICGWRFLVSTEFSDVYVTQIDKECLSNPGHYSIKAVTIDVGFYIDGDLLEVNETDGDPYQWKVDGVADASATSFSVAAQADKTNSALAFYQTCC